MYLCASVPHEKTFIMKNIVIATDLEPETENALLRSLQLAQEHKAQLHILHVAHVLSVPSFQADAKKAEKQCRSKIQAIVEKYPSWEAVDFKIHILRRGRIEDQIDNLARKLSAELVVMGADRSTRDGPPGFVRSKVEHVLWRGKYPVLAVFGDIEAAYDNILIIGKKYSIGFLDLINPNRQARNAEKLIERVKKILTPHEGISDGKKFQHIRVSPSLNLMSKIRSKQYDLVVMEVSFVNYTKPDFGEAVHKSLMDESCDILLTK